MPRFAALLASSSLGLNRFSDKTVSISALEIQFFSNLYNFNKFLNCILHEWSCSFNFIHITSVISLNSRRRKIITVTISISHFNECLSENEKEALKLSQFQKLFTHSSATIISVNVASSPNMVMFTIIHKGPLQLYKQMELCTMINWWNY